MLLPSQQVRLRWRAKLDAPLRARLTQEVEGAAYALNELEALLFDAHRATGLHHAWLAPSLDLRLPLFDLGRRFRISLTRLERTRISLLDEDGRKVADILMS